MLLKFVKKWKPVIQNNYQQLIFVFIAFFVMILVVFFSVNYMITKQLKVSTNETLRTVEANIRTSLREPEATLVSSAFTIRNMIESDNASHEDVLLYMIKLTDWLLGNKERISGFNGLYGIIQGKYLDGFGWYPPQNYNPKERPWYIAGKKGGGQIASTEIYYDAQTGLPIISYAQEILGKQGDELGVISIDVELSHITDYVCSLQLAEGGYGILLDSNLNIIAHPDKKYVNIPISNLSKDFAKVSEMLLSGKPTIDVRVHDANGVQWLVFFRQLYNGWYVAMLAPADTYYREMYIMEIGLCVLGAGLMLVLCVILLRISAEKMKSDEENRSKSSFLARMSHEIRTPMNAIIGMAELLLRKDLTNEAREDVIAIKHAGNNLFSIINDILDFSKIESGCIEIINKPYFIGSLMNDVINIIRMRAIEKDLIFLVNIDSKLPNTLLGDEVRLRQILLNLLGNAVKYTREGYISLTVSGVRNDDKVTLSFKVEDTGPGIHEKDIQKLFKEFSRVDMEANKGIEGTGLGLAITRSLCRLMEGDVTVYSEYGKGSIFTATIPQKIVEDVPFAKVEAPESKSTLLYEYRQPYAYSIMRTMEDLGVKCIHVFTEDTFEQELTQNNYAFIFIASSLYPTAKNIMNRIGVKRAKPVLLTEFGETASDYDIQNVTMPIHALILANILNGVEDINSYSSSYQQGDAVNIRFVAPTARILVVDDIATNLKVAKGLLAPYQVQVDCCTSGPEAIELIKNVNYDIVLMDHMMPNMDGIQATKIIREMEEGKFLKLPIIALTANAVSGMEEMFLSNGFDDYLAKPIELSKLNAIMGRWVPKAKQMKREEPASAQTDHQSLPFKIDGIDIQRGLLMAGGSVQNYQEILTLYCKDFRLREPYLQHIPDEDKLEDFIIQIHALKSASASIGAIKIGEMAADLEEAGVRKDMNTIRNQLGVFRQEITALVENIREYIQQTRVESSAQGMSLYDRELLLQLKEAIEEENIGRIDSLLETLMCSKTMTTEEMNMLTAIADCALISEFQEGRKILMDLLSLSEK